ncbi:hypothetical protein BOX15_Mlig020335g1 [Macrostomum lignano]|uniref:Uncharacterized protein n=2 Tax=Macrostomum lignano TaxID=282301 RepID=A0A267G4N3_9PLAT|nr:hypothetical protein BOX15_Mlig020335g1 [Macrostomum lignano]
MENGCLNGVTNGNSGNHAASTAEAAAAAAASAVSPPLNERSLETVRLIGQFLRELGLAHSVDALVQESGCALENSAAASFRRHVANGDWDAAEECMQSLQSLVTEASSATEIAFRLCEQRYMELLEAGDYMGALNVLRNRLTPLKFNTGRVHELSTYIMCSDAEELHRISGWPGSLGGTREALLDQLQQFFPPAVMLPPRRLLSLLDEAVQYQLAKCRYHNTDLPVAEVSLLADHACSRDSAEFPARCGQVADQHQDEVRCCQFSPDGRHLATGCKDGAVFIWRVDDLTLRLSVARRYHIGEERGGVACLAWSPDSRLLLCCAAEDSSDVLVWCVSPPPLLPPASAAAHHHSLLAESHPNGASVVVNSASVLSGGSSEPQRFSRGGTPEESLTTAAWFPDSVHFVAGGIRGQFYLFSLEAGYRKSWDFIRVVALATRTDRDGNTAALAADSFGRVRQYRFDTMQDETLLQEDGSIIAMCLSRDQQVAALNVVNSGLRLWDLQHRVCLQRLAGPGISQGGYCLHACFGGLTGNFLASGSQDNCAHVWRIGGADSQPDRLSGHSGIVNSVAWNPQHHGMLVTASDDCTIRVWLPTGRALSAAATDHGSGGTAATDGSSGQASANLASSPATHSPSDSNPDEDDDDGILE